MSEGPRVKTNEEVHAEKDAAWKELPHLLVRLNNLCRLAGVTLAVSVHMDIGVPDQGGNLVSTMPAL